MLLRLITCIIILFLPQIISAQQNSADSIMFNKVLRHMETKQSDSIYALTNATFREHVPHATFESASNQLMQFGKLQEWSFLQHLGDVSVYKLTFDSATLQALIGLDSAGMIKTLAFQPYWPPVKDKSYAVPSSNKLLTAQDRTIDSIARAYIQKENTVGMSIGVVKRGTMTTYGYGGTSKNNGSIPGAQHIYEIASVSKTFTSLLLAYYVLNGKISMDDPVTKYLPDSVAKNPALKHILVKHLSNHTSGLPRLPDNFFTHITDSLNPYKDYDAALLYDYLKTAITATTPGEQYAYSNLGMGLLGHIIERATGKPYVAMLKEVITGPLKMKSTFAALPANAKNRMVALYDDEGRETPAWDFKVMAPAGGLRATVHDLLLYAQSQAAPANNMLGKAMEMTQRQSYSDGTTAIGMGWHIIQVKGNTVYIHTGATNGSASVVLFAPARKTAVVILANAAVSVRDAATRMMEALL